MTKPQFSALLLEKYDPDERPMPWKGIKDPYLIWLSEIILQQTRVEQGWNYYIKFKNKYPTVLALANANEDEVLKMWEGLGYYSRARNLLAAAKYIASELKGEFPKNYNEILKLKGVGPYTAAAISSFAFNEKRAVLDGNVFRVLSRVFEIDTPIDSTKGKKEFDQLANELLDKEMPGLYNQAIMDLGAEICLPKNPKCDLCALEKICLARAHQNIELFPVKEKKLKKRNRFFDYFLILDTDNNTWIKRRSKGDIWEGLYELPCIESLENIDEKALEANKIFKNWIKNSADYQLAFVASRVHILTHQKISARLFELKINKLPSVEEFQQVNINKLNNFAFPRLINLLLEN